MHHLIINPASKSGKGVHIFERLEPYLIKQKADYQTYFTTGNGDATIFIREIIDTSVVIPVKVIVLGGDGTINEVLQGIDDFSKVILGYIPTGSSNDLARDLQLSKDPIVNLNSILDGKKTVTMDIGQITYEDGSSRKFAVSGGIGFDAAVCEEAMYSAIKDFLNHIGLGKLTYLGIALRQLFTAKKASCDLYIDDNDPIHINRLLFIASMVHKYEGGGFLFCPEASYKDGLLDICAVGNISIVRALVILPTAFFGKHKLFKGVDIYRGSNMKIHTSVPLWVHTDGEVKKKVDNITISCLRNKLTFYI